MTAKLSKDSQATILYSWNLLMILMKAVTNNVPERLGKAITYKLPQTKR